MGRESTRAGDDQGVGGRGWGGGRGRVGWPGRRWTGGPEPGTIVAMAADPRTATPDLARLVRDVADFPKPGIVFKDITPLLGDATALRHAVDATVARFRGQGITRVVGIESRGFILAPAIAIGLGCGFVPVRKPGKLPWTCAEEAYSLEYGADRVQMHVDALSATDRVLVVDDVLATGGTMAATLRLVRRGGATPVATAFLVELGFLGGAKKLDVPVFALLNY